ncbi:MAG: RNA methyltransferase [Bacteroidales bacterium]
MAKHRKLGIDELNRISAEDNKIVPKHPLVIVLDNVRSLNNIGSVFRTCDALGAEGIMLCGISATPPHPDIYKTALGAENSVTWKYYSTTNEAIEELKHNGYIIYAIEQTTNSTSLIDFKPKRDKKYAFIFGNELKGVSQDAIDSCNGTIEIPQFGSKHSFNVSVTAAIVMWDTLRKIIT